MAADQKDAQSGTWTERFSLTGKRAVVTGASKGIGFEICSVFAEAGADIVAVDDHAAYAASKGGLNALTKSMTAEWARHNIQTNAICPTVILTPMGDQVWGEPAKGEPMLAKIPLGRFGQPDRVVMG